uniref:B-cell scaffold protein with ankyrin repeats n=1 Tax=Anas zonorhyncha TaxID=75864 RepID=A0A8B9ZRW1_9AVES
MKELPTCNAVLGSSKNVLKKHMKDILVIYEQEAEEWAVYLKSLFGLVLNEEGILLYNLETLSFKHLESFSLPCYKCKLLILSCGLLKCLNRERCCFLEYVLQPPDNVVILLCGVENSEILYEVLTLGGRSREIYTDQEPAEYLSIVTGIIQPDDQSSCDFNLPDTRGAPEKADLNFEPEVLSETLEANEQSVLVLPERISCENPGEIFILLKDEIDDETFEIEFIADNQRIRTQPASWNKKVKYMKALDFPAGPVYINVYCGGVIKTTAQIEYYTALEEIERVFQKVADPIAFACQAFRFSSVEKLDSVLTLLLESKIITSEFNISQSEEHHLEEFPTLLHCAARFGLKNLAALLLKCPEATWACRIANTHGDDPASLAEKHGHKELRKLIKELSVSSYAFSYAINKQGTVMFLLISNILSPLVKPTASQSLCLKILLSEVGEEEEDDVEDSREESKDEDEEGEDTYTLVNSPNNLYASIPDDSEKTRRDCFFYKRPPPPPPRNLPGTVRQDELHSFSQERNFMEDRRDREYGDGLLTACCREEQDTYEEDDKEEHLYTFAKLDECLYDLILAEKEEEKSKECRSFIMNRPPAPTPRPVCSPARNENTPYIVQVFQQKATQMPSDYNKMYSYTTVKHSIPAEQEELIHLQKQVKKGAISVDEALDKFKQWQNENRRPQSALQVHKNKIYKSPHSESLRELHQS